jgi:two-component sensor histidine kinase
VVAQLVQVDEQTKIAERETANRMEALAMIHSAIVDGLSLQERRLRVDPSGAGIPDRPLT